MALNVLLGTVVAYFCVLAAQDVLALIRPAIDSPRTAHHSRASIDAGVNQSRSDYQAIVDRDIFNLEVPPPPPAPVVVEDLHLTLIGVSQASKGKPYAIVADSQGDQAVYRVGEIIPDSGKLLEVGRDRAVVEHGGKKVVLELPKEEMTDASDGFSANGGPFAAPIYRRRPTPIQATNDDAMTHVRARRGYLGHRE